MDDLNKIAEKLAEDPKIKKALRNILAPLKQKGDSITFSIGNEAVKIDAETHEKHS